MLANSPMKEKPRLSLLRAARLVALVRLQSIKVILTPVHATACLWRRGAKRRSRSNDDTSNGDFEVRAVHRFRAYQPDSVELRRCAAYHLTQRHGDGRGSARPRGRARRYAGSG